MLDRFRQFKMSFDLLTAFAGAGVLALLLAATPARAALEADDASPAPSPRWTTFTCDFTVAVLGSRECEIAVMRWRLCERVYVWQPYADDAFYACFRGDN
jgi:hypothetical protein